MLVICAPIVSLGMHSSIVGLLTKARRTNASSTSTRRFKARFVISLVTTASADVMRRIQVTTFKKGPKLSLDPGCRGMG